MRLQRNIDLKPCEELGGQLQILQDLLSTVSWGSPDSEQSLLDPDHNA